MNIVLFYFIVLLYVLIGCPAVLDILVGYTGALQVPFYYYNYYKNSRLYTTYL